MEGGKLTPTHYHENPIGYYKDKIPNFPPQGPAGGLHNMAALFQGGEGGTGAPLDSHAITP